MTKESIYELQIIDCNCNDCFYLVRDTDKYKSFNDIHTRSDGKIENASHRILYGQCIKFSKPISFIPNVCQIETQQCFVHRKNNQQ